MTEPREPLPASPSSASASGAGADPGRNSANASLPAPEPASAPAPARGRRSDDATDASSRLERLLYILPAACRKGGATVEDLAEHLDVSEATIVGDIKQLLERSHSLGAGSAGNMQINWMKDRIEIWTPGDFARPVRLSPRETLALGMGLRMAALSPSGGDPERREAIRRRLETHLTLHVAAHGSLSEGPAPTESGLHHFQAPELASDPEGMRELLALCARDRRRCRIRYLKPGADEEPERVIHPYVMVHAEGRWYVIAFCEAADGVRTFRIDRILAVHDVPESAEPFEIPADFEAADWFDGGRVFRADQESEAVVRYSPAIARAVAEQREGEWTEDGSYRVRHRVADTDWIVRHVLQAAGEAEVMEPESLRQAVASAARVVLESASDEREGRGRGG